MKLVKTLKTMKGKMLLAFFNLLGTCLLAQESTTASGGNATGSGGSVSYSVGQPAYIANNGSAGSVSEGVQQAYVISVITGLDNAPLLQLCCSAYPNPAVDYLVLNTGNYKASGLSFYLYDSNGKLMESQKITAIETTINMANFPTAMYYLRVRDDKQEVKSFKLIKR